jgi:hypothetical protein
LPSSSCCFPLWLLFAFHAMRGMYLHAERLLAKAGRQSARGGVSPTRSKAEGKRSEGLHKRSAEDCGKPLALRQGGALSEAWFPYSCASAHMISRVGVSGRNEVVTKLGLGNKEEDLAQNCGRFAEIRPVSGAPDYQELCNVFVNSAAPRTFMMRFRL